jgi:hypothetical protein
MRCASTVEPFIALYNSSWELQRIFYFNNPWVKAMVLLLKLKPPCGGLTGRHTTVSEVKRLQICDGHTECNGNSPTDTSARLGVAVV